MKYMKDIVYSPVSGSVVTAAVNPTPDEPRPVVGMARGAEWRTYLDEGKHKLGEQNHRFIIKCKPRGGGGGGGGYLQYT